jgi:hypothetical protein
MQCLTSLLSLNTMGASSQKILESLDQHRNIFVYVKGNPERVLTVKEFSTISATKLTSTESLMQGYTTDRSRIVCENSEGMLETHDLQDLIAFP